MKDETGEAAGLLAVMRDITARKQLEQEVRQNEEEFRSMFELSAVGKVLADPLSGLLLRVNKKICEITGYSAAELLTMTFMEITHPDDLVQDLQCYKLALDTKSPGWMGEKRYIRKDGGVIWVKETGTVMFDAGGNPLRSMAVVEDVTERKLADQALRQSEERYRSLVQSSPEAICVQQDGPCVFLNPAGLGLLGAESMEEVKGRRILDFIHSDFRENAAERLRQVELQGVSDPFRELKILRLNGQELDVEAAASPIIFQDRPAIQIIIKDISINKNTELRLRLQATVLSQITEAVVAVGRDGSIVFWNQGAERIYKLKPEEAIGKQREDIYRYRWLDPKTSERPAKTWQRPDFCGVKMSMSSGTVKRCALSLPYRSCWTGPAPPGAGLR